MSTTNSSTVTMTVTVTETANVLGISRSSAYECVRIGAIPSIRLGRRIVVPSRSSSQLRPSASRRLPTEQCGSDLCGLALLTRHHMTVRVEREADRRMTEPFAHHLRVDAGSEKMRRVRVAKVVQADPRDARRLDQPVERLADAVRSHRLADLVREHAVVGRRRHAELEQFLALRRSGVAS